MVLTFDRTMDPQTVTQGNITLSRTGGSTGSYTVACSSPCLSAVIDPAGQLDGEYTVSWGTGVKSEEGVALEAGSATFDVAAFETRFDGGCALWSTNPAPNQWSCPANAARGVVNPLRGSLLGGLRVSETVGPSVPYTGDNNPMYVSFDSSFSTTDTNNDSFAAGLSFDGGACTYAAAFNSSGPKTTAGINAPSNRSQVAVCFKLTIVGSGGGESAAGAGLTVDNVVLDRVP